MNRTIGARNLYLGHAMHRLYILEPMYSTKCFPRLLGSKDVANCLLVFIRQARGQEFLLQEFYSELGGFGLKVLVFFLGGFVVVECHLCGYREGVDDATAMG